MTIVGLGVGSVLFCLVTVFIGATLQGSIGTGLGMFAAPLLTIVDHDFVPAAILISVVPLTVGMAVRERAHVDRSGVTRAFAGRIPGTFVGAWVAANTGPTAIAIIVGATVLLAVTASLTGFHFRPTARNVVLAGAASGFTGTATGVGGPPMAITYQHSDPRTLRATLAVYFVVGGLFSIIVLVANGVIGRRELELGLLLVPGVIAGLLFSKVTVRHMPPERVRPMVLGACAISALSLLIETVV